MSNFLFTVPARNSPFKVRATTFHGNVPSLVLKLISHYLEFIDSPKLYKALSFEAFLSKKYYTSVYGLKDGQRIKKLSTDEIVDLVLKCEHSEVKKELVKLKLKYTL